MIMGILLKNSYQRFNNYTPCERMERDHAQLYDRAAPHTTVNIN